MTGFLGLRRPGESKPGAVPDVTCDTKMALIYLGQIVALASGYTFAAHGSPENQ